jgi:hypothetical protein
MSCAGSDRGNRGGDHRAYSRGATLDISLDSELGIAAGAKFHLRYMLIAEGIGGRRFMGDPYSARSTSCG